MEGCFGGDHYNDWDLNSVVRRGCGLAQPPHYYDPFFALTMAHPQAPNMWQQHAMDMLAVAKPAANMWQQPEMDVPAVSDEDFLAQVFFPVHQPAAPAAPSTNEVGAAAGNSPPAVVKSASSNAAGSSSSRPNKQIRNNKKKAEVTAMTTVPWVNLPTADLWSWHKYGQKLIKGNPYPRSYYRCSADDSCPARRQTERDGEIVNITYIGHHKHAVPCAKNPLAGTTRRNRRRKASPPPTGPNADVLAGGPSHQTPPPVPVPAAPAVRPNEFEAEEDDDAIALKCLIDDAVRAPGENMFLQFRGPQPAPVFSNSAFASVLDFASGRHRACDRNRLL